MKFFSVRDFRAESTAIFSTGSGSEDFILTNHGKPAALVIPLNEDNFEETLRAVRGARALQAARAIRAQSVKSGTDAMTLADIHAEISAVRKARKKRKP